MYSLMETTEHIARIYSANLFDLLERDAEHVIMVINYMLEKIEKEPDTAKPRNEAKPKPKQKDTFWNF